MLDTEAARSHDNGFANAVDAPAARSDQLQDHETNNVFRLIDAPLKPCHQNGMS
jgi:hypothetical protein